MEKDPIPQGWSSQEKAKENDNESETIEHGGFFRIFTFGEPVDYFFETIGIAAAIASGVAMALVNIVLGNFINLLTTASGPDIQGLGSDYMAGVQKYSLYFVYIGIARLCLTYMYSTLMTQTAYRIVRNIRCRYLRAALSQDISFFDHDHGGSISARLSANGKLIQSGIAEKLGQVFQALATFIAAFIIAFVSQWKLTLILICIIPTILGIIGAAAWADSRIDVKILKNNALADTYSESILSSIKTIHAFNLRPRLLREYSSYTQKSFEIARMKSWIYGILFGSQNFVIYSGMGLAFWQGIAMISKGEVESIGTVFTVLFSVIIAAATMNSLAPHLISFTRAISAANELFALIDRESEINPFSKSGIRPEQVTGAIEFKNVHFAYPARPDNPVMEDFSLVIPAGKITALVGSSGSGKSTAIGLIERWYNPTMGSITLDGVDVKELDVTWLRTNVRLVQQEPVLFNGTIFENISYGLVGTEWEFSSKEVQLKLVKEAAVTAFIDEFIQNLPHGYDTQIGERGGLLSGGQKQRVAIARSIVSRPKILLLDEATSALDPQAEEIVQQALERASENRTTIAIAHKLKTICNADNIVVLSRGQIIEQGKHNELVANQSTYARLVKVQDLSVAAHDHAEHEAKKDENDQEDQVEKAQSLARYNTAEADRLSSLQAKENFSAFEQGTLIQTIARLVHTSWDLRWWYLVSLVTCTVGAAVYPGQSLLIAKVTDVFSSPNMVEKGNFISLMFFVMAIGSLCINFILGVSTNVISQSLYQRFRNAIFNGVLRQDLSFFDRPENTIGAMNSRLSSYPHSIMELMGFNIAVIVIAAINIFASSILSISVSWKLGLVGVFAGLPPMILAGWVRYLVETKMDSIVDKRSSQSASVASEAVMAIRTVSSLAIEEKVLEKYAVEQDAAISSSTNPLCQMMVWFSLTQSIEYFVLALGFWWGSTLLSRGELTFYQFMVSFMGLYFSAQSAGQFFSFIGNFPKANHAANYYFWISSLQPTISSSHESRDRGSLSSCSEYDFENVKFSYPLAPENQVLKGISLKIMPGQFVAFVGASGCGKSTMIALLERFYDPSSGRIIVDKQNNLKDLNPWVYRNKVALVQQEPTLFPTTIRANVSMGVDFDLNKTEPYTGLPSADVAALERALKAADAWDFVSSLPEGLDTPCGTSGIQLSGGQRQRIAIARALIRNPHVLLLDEATSALDTESERIVQSALMDAVDSGKHVTVAVAHRLSTVRRADRIFVFYGGKIAEAGTHNELISQGGIYTKMCEAQSIDSAA
ncbi:unnamed protein product [Clonostachys byssicola]|uniref:Leptomycin B resistance protein pmd1 n=1 Tax=Clonostachys byssicola TaxID=160290 RepID=A0A9N9YAT9_9HYPO|nr:unnamed protein product [Clonostachys byssicola]